MNLLYYKCFILSNFLENEKFKSGEIVGETPQTPLYKGFLNLSFVYFKKFRIFKQERIRIVVGENPTSHYSCSIHLNQFLLIS